jgi:hypothetical protein
MLAEGERIPEATVWTGPRDSNRLADLVAGRPALLVFYLFDFSST